MSSAIDRGCIEYAMVKRLQQCTSSVEFHSLLGHMRWCESTVGAREVVHSCEIADAAIQ